MRKTCTLVTYSCIVSHDNLHMFQFVIYDTAFNFTEWMLRLSKHFIYSHLLVWSSSTKACTQAFTIWTLIYKNKYYMSNNAAHYIFWYEKDCIHIWPWNILRNHYNIIILVIRLFINQQIQNNSWTCLYVYLMSLFTFYYKH